MALVDFDPKSIASSRNLPARRLASSENLAWRCAFAAIHETDNDIAEFETDVTGDQTIVVALSGSCLVESRNAGLWRRALYSPGAVGLTAPDETARLRFYSYNSDRTHKTLHIYIPKASFAEAEDEMRAAGIPFRGGRIHGHCLRDGSIAAAGNIISNAIQSEAPDLYVAPIINWLVRHVLRSTYQGRLKEAPQTLEAVTDRRLARTIDFMIAHLSDDISLDTLAKEAGISRFHFSRLFREATGLSPYRMLTRLRMETAHDMIQRSDAPLIAVAAACGYNRLSYFSAVFEHHFAVRPNDIRRLGRST